MSEKFEISIEKDVARYVYKVGIELDIDGLELEKDPGGFAQMLNKEFKKIILEIQAQMQIRNEFIENHKIFVPKYYLCPKCGQRISEAARKEHEKRWFDYSVCPQPGGIIHIRREDEQVPKLRMASEKKEPEKGQGDLAAHLLSSGSKENK